MANNILLELMVGKTKLLTKEKYETSANAAKNNQNYRQN